MAASFPIEKSRSVQEGGHLVSCILKVSCFASILVLLNGWISLWARIDQPFSAAKFVCIRRMLLLRVCSKPMGLATASIDDSPGRVVLTPKAWIGPLLLKGGAVNRQISVAQTPVHLFDLNPLFPDATVS